MCLSVLGYSLLPLLIVTVGGAVSPFLLGGSQAVGHVVGGLVFLYGRYPRSMRNRTVRGTVRRNVRSSAVLFSALAPFTFAFLAWSAAYLDATIATVLWGSWPILVVLFLARFDRASESPDRRRRGTVTVSLVLLMLLGLVGLGFAVMSQTATDSAAGLAGLTDGLSVVGVVIALGSAWLASLTAWHFRWADSLVEQTDKDTLAEMTPTRFPLGDNRHEGSLLFVVVCLVIGNMIAAPIMLTAAFLSGEQAGWLVVLGGFAVGLAVRTPAAVWWRMSNLVTRDYGVNAINFLEPLLALLWLGLLWDTRIENTDFLVIGVTAVMASNILINSRVEIGTGFKATVIALWTSGVVVYFRPDSIRHQFDGYFESLSLSATVFALILVFRVSRVLTVTSQEDQAFIRLWHQFELAIRRDTIRVDPAVVFDSLQTIDTSRHVHRIEPACLRLRSLLRHASDGLTADDTTHTDLSGLQTELHAFTHSKQRPWNFGELFALCAFALLTVGLALLGHPPAQPWAAFLIDLFVVPFSAVIVFLIFNAWDLQQNRNRQILRTDPTSPTGNSPQLSFHQTDSHHGQRTVSVLVSIGIWAAFGYLYSQTWL